MSEEETEKCKEKLKEKIKKVVLEKMNKPSNKISSEMQKNIKKIEENLILLKEGKNLKVDKKYEEKTFSENYLLLISNLKKIKESENFLNNLFLELIEISFAFVSKLDTQKDSILILISIKLMAQNGNEKKHLKEEILKLTQILNKHKEKLVVQRKVETLVEKIKKFTFLEKEKTEKFSKGENVLNFLKKLFFSFEKISNLSSLVDPEFSVCLQSINESYFDLMESVFNLESSNTKKEIIFHVKNNFPSIIIKALENLKEVNKKNEKVLQNCTSLLEKTLNCFYQLLDLIRKLPNCSHFVIEEENSSIESNSQQILQFVQQIQEATKKLENMFDDSLSDCQNIDSFSSFDQNILKIVVALLNDTKQLLFQSNKAQVQLNS